MGSVGVSRPLINRAELNTKLERAGEKEWTFKFSEPTDFDRQMMKETADSYKQIANEMLEYFSENNLPIITPSSDYDDMIVWYYSGTDRQDKNFMSGETSDYPKKSSISETMAGNGITPRFLAPKNVADYVINRTNMEPEVMKVAEILTTQALKEYKKRR